MLKQPKFKMGDRIKKSPVSFEITQIIYDEGHEEYRYGGEGAMEWIGEKDGLLVCRKNPFIKGDIITDDNAYYIVTSVDPKTEGRFKALCLYQKKVTLLYSQEIFSYNYEAYTKTTIEQLAYDCFKEMFSPCGDK